MEDKTLSMSDISEIMEMSPARSAHKKRTPSKPVFDPSPSGKFIPESFSGNFGDTKDCDFIRGAFLGKGAFSRVYVYTVEGCRGSVEPTKVAVKVVNYKNPNSVEVQLLKDEINVHRYLVNERIVKYHGMFIEHGHIVVISELCVLSLQDVLSDKTGVKKALYLDYGDCIRYSGQLVEGLEYMKKQGYVHCDMKPGNIFLKSTANEGVMDIKIGDFGMTVKENTRIQRRGTPNYISPEVLYPPAYAMVKGYYGEDGIQYTADLWALGCIIYAMLYDKPPFQTSKVVTTYERIKTATFSFPEDMGSNPDAESLILSILQRNPASRMGYYEMKLHPFFGGYFQKPKSSVSKK